jgi:type VI secretion system protein VasG
MEKQALLEDIAVGNSAHGERLAAIEQDEIRIILELDELETQYGQELKLTEQLLACRAGYLPPGRNYDLQRNSLSCSKQPAAGPGCGCAHRRHGDCRLDRRAALLADEG